MSFFMKTKILKVNSPGLPKISYKQDRERNDFKATEDVKKCFKRGTYSLKVLKKK